MMPNNYHLNQYPANVHKRPAPVSWPGVSQSSHNEGVEYRLIANMSHASQFTLSLRSILGFLKRIIDFMIQIIWRIVRGPGDLRNKEIYRVKVKETLNRSMVTAVVDLTIEPQENGGTVLEGTCIDQPALRSLLNQLWNLNFTILSVERIDDPRHR